MVSKGPIYRGIHAKDKVLSYVKILLEPINKLDLSCKTSLATFLVCFHRNSCRKMGQKTCMNKAQVVEQVAATIEESTTSENMGWGRILSPRFPPLHVFSILASLQLCSIFLPISTNIFSMLEAELALVENMKAVILWFSSQIHEESSNVEVCRLINDQNTFEWSIPCFSFWQQKWPTVFWHYVLENSWTGFWCLDKKCRAMC